MALTDNIRAAYQLSDTSDATGNGYTLTNTGTVTFSSGLIGDAAILGDNNNTKNLSISSALGVALADNWTISYFWKATTSSYANVNCLEFCWGATGSGNNNRIMGIRDQANNRWGLYNSAFSGNWTVESITGGNWYHIVIEKSSSTVTYYVNTTSKGSVTVGANTNLTPRIGLNRQDEATWWHSGDIDLWYIWNRALSSDERSALYNSGSGLQYPFTTTHIKKFNGIPYANIKKINGIPIANVKKLNGIT